MKSFAFAAVIGVATAIDANQLGYLNHLAKFTRQVETEAEFNMRAQIFAEVDAFINENNASDATHVAGHNKFSDWTYAEYKNLMGYRRAPGTRPEGVVPTANSIPASVNWVELGGVTDVKDQGQCGSCWSFSTTGSLEGAHFIATGELLSFSEQQLVDCAFLGYGNLACNGGLQDNAYNYYEDGHKAELESVYPYFSGTTMSKGTCNYNADSTTAVSVSSYTHVAEGSASGMRAALVQQPLAVAIEADTRVFQTYSSGVLSGTACGENLDHAVLAVGYGTDAATGLDYFLVKNSWSSSWGDQGYIKLAATADGTAGTCGIQLDAEWPTTSQ